MLFETIRSGEIKVLVATDVAGRGIHIDDISHVFNYTLPYEADDYVHRIGRTGRAGKDGISISFADEDGSFYLPAIEEYIGYKLDCVQPDEALLKPAPKGHVAISKQVDPQSRGGFKPKYNKGRRPPMKTGHHRKPSTPTPG
ncbi:MAG: hypothetical protein HQK66_14595 [Desulfamplus sp.]|nr:hypothetical protein [Desulfamplus sp.]